MATVIRGDDNFDTTPPSFGRVVLNSGNTTTTSTSLVDVAGASITITTGANPVAYAFSSSWLSATQWAFLGLNVLVDGVRQYGNVGLRARMAAANTEQIVNAVGQSVVLTAGSHTIKVQFNTDTGTNTLRTAAQHSSLFSVHEIK